MSDNDEIFYKLITDMKKTAPYRNVRLSAISVLLMPDGRQDYDLTLAGARLLIDEASIRHLGHDWARKEALAYFDSLPVFEPEPQPLPEPEPVQEPTSEPETVAVPEPVAVTSEIQPVTVPTATIDIFLPKKPQPQGSPFDGIRHVRDDGSEYWSARELMPLMGYARWRNFALAIDKARIASDGLNMDTASHFADVSKTPAGGGPRSENYALSRYACYLVAMNGDPSKAEVAAAQTYFVARTRQAELAPTQQLTGPELMALALVEAKQTLEANAEHIAELTAKIDDDAPKVFFANAVAGSPTSISVNELAGLLNQNGYGTGVMRLFDQLRDEGYLIKDAGSTWNLPTQRSRDLKIFEIKETLYEASVGGGQKIHRTTVVTGKGQQYFINKYCPKNTVAIVSGDAS